MSSGGRTSVEDGLANLLVEVEQARSPAPRRLSIGRLTRAQKAAELARVQARRAMDAAYEAELVLALAADTPDTLDPAPGTPGARSSSWAPDAELPGVSEFFVPESAATLNCGRVAATRRAVRAWVWRESLPATFAALAAGAVDEPRATALADVLAHASVEAARQVEQRLLPQAVHQSVGKLRARAIALLVQVDRDGAGDRRKAAERTADVRIHPAPADGIATLAADLPTPTAAACRDTVDRLAGMLEAGGDARPIGQLRAAVLADLVLRPWDATRPPVTAHLTVLAPLPPSPAAASRPARWVGSRSPPATCGPCSPTWTRSASGHPPADRWTSRSPTPTAHCAPPEPPGDWTGWPAAAARPIRPATAAARCWTPRRPPPPTGPPTPSGGPSAPATAPAASPTAPGRSAGRTATTPFRTPTAAGPAAPTCAACAGPTTG
jgi:hypothetical protein